MTKEKGLTSNEVKLKIKQYGLNEIKDINKTSVFKIFLRQIKSNFIVYLLFAAALISFFVGKNITAYTILAVILSVIIVGFVQEYRSEKAIGALKAMLLPVAIVIRDGKEQEIEAINIVPEDILLLRTGEKIPADCILLEEKELKVNEAILTGESKEISKNINNQKENNEDNLIFMGTYVVNGRCIAKVIHTGMNTKFGKIAKLISTTEKELPLQKKVNKIAKYMAILAMVVSVTTGALMFLRADLINTDFIVNVLILVIALSVSAFPEGLPVVLITTLSSGAYRMAKLNAIVNRMSIIETLGETTVVCSDKTGTITKGEMTVRKIFINDLFFNVTGTGYQGKGEFLLEDKNINLKDYSFDLLFKSAILCNDSRIEKTGENSEYKTFGSPTEAALLIMGAKANFFKDDLFFERLEEIPFSSERKMMSVSGKENQEEFIYTKGALEYLIKSCKFIQKKDGIFDLTLEEKNKILEINNSMALGALRTLAFAYKKNNSLSKEKFEDNLIFIGLVGMEDPPREEVKNSIQQCYKAGISVKMITGDNKETALAVAKEINLIGKLIEGHELEKITDEELAQAISEIVIFARVKPEHKLRIIKALKLNGEIVTMTGDGVNDAPALKEAHIGVAMGKNGTDVSRSVADLTLKDDNFSTIVLAIKEGRTIFKNIRKFVTYQLSCNFSELAILFFGVLLAPIFGWQIPLLLALQILFMNLITDNLPAITLGFNNVSEDIMIEKPRRNNQILNKKLILLLISTGGLMTFFTLLSYLFTFNFLGESAEYSRTVALFTLICLEIMLAFNFRSFRKGVLNRSLLINPYLFYASAISLITAFLIIYSPLNKLFETVPLQLNGILIGVMFALILTLIFDFLKKLNKQNKFIILENILKS